MRVLTLLTTLFTAVLSFAGELSVQDAFDSCDPNISFGTTAGECDLRAQSWCESLRAKGYRTKQITTFTTCVNNAVVDQCEKVWGFHTAPLIELDGVYYVIDPGWADGPLSPNEWVPMMGGSPVVHNPCSPNDVLNMKKLGQKLDDICHNLPYHPTTQFKGNIIPPSASTGNFPNSRPVTSAFDHCTSFQLGGKMPSRNKISNGGLCYAPEDPFSRKVRANRSGLTKGGRLMALGGSLFGYDIMAAECNAPQSTELAWNCAENALPTCAGGVRELGNIINTFADATACNDKYVITIPTIASINDRFTNPPGIFDNCKFEEPGECWKVTLPGGKKVTYQCDKKPKTLGSIMNPCLLGF